MATYVNRQVYLQKLIDRRDNGEVKIITGTRRCGKSWLLKKLYHDYLVSQGVQKNNIIMVSFDVDEDIAGEDLTDPTNCLGYIQGHTQTIDDAVVTEYEDNKPKVSSEDSQSQAKSDTKHKRPRFKFSMVGIKIGEMVVFNPTGVEVKVASDDTIGYEGRIYKLSPFVGTFVPLDKQTPSGAYQGAKYFSYKGKVLDDLRNEMEKDNK